MRTSVLPNGLFCMKTKQKREVMRWLTFLNFSNGFTMGFRGVLNLKKEILIGLKSHDYHVTTPSNVSRLLE